MGGFDKSGGQKTGDRPIKAVPRSYSYSQKVVLGLLVEEVHQLGLEGEVDLGARLHGVVVQVAGGDYGHHVPRVVWSYKEMDFGLADSRMDAVRGELLNYL